MKESTVRTVLHRLEEKGYLRHSKDNRTYVYHAVKAPRQVAAIAVKRIVDWLCDGSMEELFVGMVDIEVVDRDELQHIVEFIRRGGMDLARQKEKAELDLARRRLEGARASASGERPSMALGDDFGEADLVLIAGSIVASILDS